MLPSPRNAAAPGLATEGGANTQANYSDTLILPRPPSERERAQRRARLADQEHRRNAARALDALFAQRDAHFDPSERWQRRFANELVAMGFDPEYVARRTGLSWKRSA